MSDETSARANRVDASIRVAKEIGARGGSPLGRVQEPAMARATATPTEVAFRVFRKLLDAHGLRYALYSLLRLTDYRFISVFRLHDGMISSVAHVDREDLSVQETALSPETASYCCYVRTEEGPFTIVDALLDPRVEGHGKQQALRAYCGVPVTSGDGRLLGTLCHYDVVPRDPAQLDAALLAQVADEIVRLGALAGADATGHLPAVTPPSA